MDKMTIIEVDLGKDIDDIINDDVDTIGKETQELIDNAIAQKESVTKKRSQRVEAKQLAEQRARGAIERIYGLLEELPAGGHITLAEMVEVAGSAISTSSGLILQLKSFMRKEKGNKFVLKRRTIDKKPSYILLPFNVED